MSDPRFARFKSDPRFRRPKKKHNKVVIDDRFESILKPSGGSKKNGKHRARVDRYGRPVSETQENDDLRRYYRIGGDIDDDDKNQIDDSQHILVSRPDLARGEVLLESSDEEDGHLRPMVKRSVGQKEDEDSGSDDSDSPHIITIGGDPQDLGEVDLNEDAYADLDAQAAAYSANANAEVVEGTRTRRLAIVNLDWDHVRAAHLYKICSSLVSPAAPIMPAGAAKPSDASEMGKSGSITVVRGRVLNVRVYPSEFGKVRMEREEREGPPPEIFKRGKADEEMNEEDVNERNVYEVGGEEEYNEDALRQYQLERLRYYYALVTCDTVDAASHIYNELDGTELERSANVFDLSFVPDDMTFDEEFRDEATEELNSLYKGIDFVTDALRHSKVKLTWDQDDQERNQVTRRKLTKEEIEDGDFRAYLASSSEESDNDDGHNARAKDRDQLRALLLAGNEEAMPEGWGDDDAGDVDMEITFTPGLSSTKPEGEETTLDRYRKKIKEKRKKHKEEVKEKVEEKGGLVDDFFEPGSDDGDESVPRKKGSAKKGQNSSKEGTARPISTPEELELLVSTDNPGGEPQHFDLKAVLKSEKQGKKRRKGKKTRKGDNDQDEIQEDFAIDVKDERFKVLHEDHQFAIDPSNPQFKRTKSMAAFLEERQKIQRQKHDLGDIGGGDGGKNVKSSSNLKSLVASVKRKSLQPYIGGSEKKRKV